jgi:hypothetical protein
MFIAPLFFTSPKLKITQMTTRRNGNALPYTSGKEKKE